MKETNDGEMLFDPAEVDVKEGATIRFRIGNVGEVEFVLDDHENIMEREDPNAVRLDPGKAGEVIWTFTNAGEFELACLIPGHYESGMKGELFVVETASWQPGETSTCWMPRRPVNPASGFRRTGRDCASRAWTFEGRRCSDAKGPC